MIYTIETLRTELDQVIDFAASCKVDLSATFKNLTDSEFEYVLKRFELKVQF